MSGPRPPEVYETPRLILRIPRMDDAKAIFESYAQDEEVTRYLLWRPHKTINDTTAFLHYAFDGWQHGTEYTWAITLKQERSLIGMIGLRISIPKADFGYVLAKRYWNKGYMTEAVQRLVEWAFTHETCERVTAESCTGGLVAGAMRRGFGPPEAGPQDLSPSHPSGPRPSSVVGMRKKRDISLFGGGKSAGCQEENKGTGTYFSFRFRPFCHPRRLTVDSSPSFTHISSRHLSCPNGVCRLTLFLTFSSSTSVSGVSTNVAQSSGKEMGNGSGRSSSVASLRP